MTEPKRMNGPTSLIEVRAKEIPQWIRDIAAPADRPLEVVLTDARYMFVWFEHYEWRPWFVALADALISRIGAPPFSEEELSELLKTIDLVPGLLDRGGNFLDPTVYGYIVGGVSQVFTQRQYAAYDRLRKHLGKPRSGQDVGVLRLYGAARSRGMNEQQAIAYVQEAFPTLSPAGVLSAVKRARKSPFGPMKTRLW